MSNAFKNIAERAYSTFYMSFVGSGATAAIAFTRDSAKVLEAAAIGAGVTTVLSLAKNLSVFFTKNGNGSLADAIAVDAANAAVVPHVDQAALADDTPTV